MQSVLHRDNATAQTSSLNVVHRPEQLMPDDKRVITRLFDPHNPRRVRAILNRVMRLDRQEVVRLLAGVLEDFAPRHRDIEAAFLENYRAVVMPVRPDLQITHERQLLLGSYFTMEYSIESAALFNPD
jgi:hypothetical protein